MITPEIEAWSLFWKWLIVIGSSLFLVLMVYTLFHGAIDIRNLLAALGKSRDEGRQEDTH